MAKHFQDELCEQFDVSRESLMRLETYVSVLLSWQERINLIGASTVDQVWSRHIADSLQLRSFFPPGTPQLADLGSGAGIPGLVIAIATSTRVHLYESNGKKAAFLREAIRQTRATATVHQIRIEQLHDEVALPGVQIILARAFAPLERLIGYAEPFLKKGAIGLFHKGQDVDAELTAAAKCWKLNYIKHPSIIDSNGVILEVKEATRVQY